MAQSGEDSNPTSSEPAQRRLRRSSRSMPTTKWLHIARFVLVCCLYSYTSPPVSSAHSYGLLSDESEDSSRQEQLGIGGSWSHWWSYDGISGPDYWNINKHWRLCASGRKQSPVDIRTERLVYDHLLGPLRVRWQQQQQRKSHQEDRNDKSNQTIPVKLINSGRGLEVWLERTSALIDSELPAGGSSQTATKIDHNNGEKLLLSKGPLSYEYKLFKIELHSAPAAAAAAATGGGNRFGQTIPATSDGDEIANDDNADDDEQDADEENSLGDNNGLNQADDANKFGPKPRKGPSSSRRVPEAMRSARSSEHLIDGRAFEAELQLHFHNRHLASSGHEALRLANEQPLASLFAVISVLISLKPNRSEPNDNKTPDQSGTENATIETSGPLDFVLNHLNQVQNQADSLELKLSRAQLEALITDRSQYVTYQGSMNRPPCAESVDWIILNRPLSVRANKFLQLFDKLNTNQENVRPTRQLNNRLLRTTISNLHYKRSPSSSSEATGGGGGRDGELEKCQKTNCNLALRSNVNRTRSSPVGADQLDTISSRHPNKALHRYHQQQQQCSMKPNYVYEFSYK